MSRPAAAASGPKVRFAPSPTGHLHVGNARIALINWLFARRHGGALLLRIDDTDILRSTTEYEAAILEDLAWLGLDHDQFLRQSDRMEQYRAALGLLKHDGRVYPCYESEAELRQARREAVDRGRPPIYDRAALALTEAEHAEMEAAGRRPHWRFRLEPETAAWDDLVRGPVEIGARHLSDPVLQREDGRPLYALTTAVDDLECGISHIIRGEDHVPNTAVQVQVMRALGGDPEAFVFAHPPLMVDAAGRSLSKRLGSLSLRGLREEGVEAMAVNSLLARLGSSAPVEPRADLEALVEDFDIGLFGRAPPKFDPKELFRLGARVLHAMPFVAVRERLAALGLEAADETFWQVVRPNLETLDEARGWWQVCHGEVGPAGDDAPFMEAAASLLPDEPWGEDTWTVWTKALATRTGRRGRELFQPLRQATTGREHGPEMKHLLPLIGRARTLARLSGNSG